ELDVRSRRLEHLARRFGRRRAPRRQLERLHDGHQSRAAIDLGQLAARCLGRRRQRSDPSMAALKLPISALAVAAAMIGGAAACGGASIEYRSRCGDSGECRVIIPDAATLDAQDEDVVIGAPDDEDAGPPVWTQSPSFLGAPLELRFGNDEIAVRPLYVATE